MSEEVTERKKRKQRLENSLLAFAVKTFDKFMPTKCFDSLNKHLQDYLWALKIIKIMLEYGLVKSTQFQFAIDFLFQKVQNLLKIESWYNDLIRMEEIATKNKEQTNEKLRRETADQIE
jgi:hypothetical protein